jgi:hypothetical protein
VSVGPQPRPLADRFWEKVDVRGPDECWEWTAGRFATGYGQFANRPGPPVYAHRTAWQLVNGPVPDGQQVLHHCDNPPCCNARHLFLGSNADNREDQTLKGRAAKELTAADVHEIRRLLADPLMTTRTAIGERFGVSRATVYHIATGKTWRWLCPT